MDAAQRQVEAFDGPVHAVVGFWDFPVSTMVPILCERLGLRWASVESVVKCEHKYWSRLEQAKVIDEIPGFGLLDLENPVLPDGLGYPVWVKPVRSASSELAFRATIPYSSPTPPLGSDAGSGVSATLSARFSVCWSFRPSWPASVAAPALSRRRWSGGR